MGCWYSNPCEGKTSSDNVAEAFFRVHVLSLFVVRKVGAKKTSRCIRNYLQPGAVPKDEQFRPAGLQTIVKGLLDQMLQVLPRFAYLVKLGIEFLCQLVSWSDRFCFQYWPRMTMTYKIIQAMFLFHSILQWGGLRQHIPSNEHVHLYTPFLVVKIRSVWKQCVKSLYRWTWNCPWQHLRKPVLLAMLQPEDTILQLLNAMSDRLACHDGFVQLASSWRHMPIVPHLSEDLSDIQDLPRVSWMYESVSDFLDTCFRLLRADCFIPLQKGIRDFINGSLDPRDVRIFRGSFQHFHLVRGSKGLVASIECTNVFNYAVPFPARVLMPSNLICLSISERPFEEVLWGRVAERPGDRAAQKKETMTVTIEFLDDLTLAGVLEGFRILFFRPFSVRGYIELLSDTNRWTYCICFEEERVPQVI